MTLHCRNISPQTMSIFGLTSEWFNLKESVYMFLSQIRQVNCFQFFNIVWSLGENGLCRLRICKCFGKLVGIFFGKYSLGFLGCFPRNDLLTDTQTNSVEVHIRYIIVFKFFTYYYMLYQQKTYLFSNSSNVGSKIESVMQVGQLENI